MESKTPPCGPLAGIRVVDLTAMVFGPYATAIMADMGADVIKVEPPKGDDTRFLAKGPTPDLNGVFAVINRGKRSVALDLRAPEGKAALNALIATADVFIHSMRGPAIAKLGFDYAGVSAIRPDIVYVNCYGYGRAGPYAGKPAYDDTIQAESGFAACQAMLTGTPGFVGSIVADKVGGLTAAYATAMALFHRARTGEGQEVEVPMFETLASFVLAEHANGAVFDPPTGPTFYPRAVAPNRKPYQTKDGHVAALIYNDKHWAAFVGEVKPAWAGPDLATLPQRAARIDEVYARLGDVFRSRTTAEWLELLARLEIPAARINTPEDLLRDPHLNAVGFFHNVPAASGTQHLPGIPTLFSKTPGAIQGPTPQLGEHTDEVLKQLGLA